MLWSVIEVYMLKPKKNYIHLFTLKIYEGWINSRRQIIGHLLLDHVSRLGRDSAPMKYQIMILLHKQDLNNDNTSWQETWIEKKIHEVASLSTELRESVFAQRA